MIINIKIISDMNGTTFSGKVFKRGRYESLLNYLMCDSYQYRANNFSYEDLFLSHKSCMAERDVFVFFKQMLKKYMLLSMQNIMDANEAW